MDYKKPQSALVQDGVGIYPLTTADQIILQNGSRLEKDGKIRADSALDSAKLGGKAPEYYLQPRNLLDNSDFRNPVNQRGQSSYSGGYTIDRWRIWEDGEVTVNNGYLSHSVALYQYIPDLDKNKTYTLAFQSADGTVYCSSSKPVDNVSGDAGINIFYDENLGVCARFWGNEGYTNKVWAALYEGTYTADTLPPYVPKGYAQELAECQRYYENSWFGSSKTVRQEYFAHVWDGAHADARIDFKQQKRIAPTIAFYPVGTEINWKIYNGNYYFINSIENIGRGGLSGFIARISKGSSDSTTWTPGYTIQAQGHWEASADL